MSDRLTEVARRLWRPIPVPPRPKPQPQATWATLKSSQRLELLERWFDGRRRYEPGTVFEVVSVDSQGMRLVPAAHLTGPQFTGKLSDLSRWEDRQWQRLWKKVRRPARGRRKETVHE